MIIMDHRGAANGKGSWEICWDLAWRDGRPPWNQQAFAWQLNRSRGELLKEILSPLLFVLSLIPLSVLHREARQGYDLSRRQSHYKIKYSCAVPLTSTSYMLKLCADCVCPQTSVAKIESCLLQDKYSTAPPTMITHTCSMSSDKQTLHAIVLSFIHQTKGLLF